MKPYIIKDSTDIAVAIIDLKIPEISGITVIKKAKKKNIPVLIISGLLETDPLIDEVKKMGYNAKEDLLFKPIDPFKLSEIIRIKLSKME